MSLPRNTHLGRRRRRRVRWTLGQLFVLMTLVAGLTLFGKEIYPHLGYYQFWEVVCWLVGAGLYTIAPTGATLVAEALSSDAQQRVHIADRIVALFALPLFCLTVFIAAHNVWPAVGFAAGVLGLWALPLLPYWLWREDEISPQLAVLRRLRMERPTVAIVGASADRTKFGNKSVRAYLRKGYDVYPVNPKGGEIEGRRVFTSLAEIPVPLTRVSVYLPPEIGVKVLDEIKAKGCQELYLNPGSDSDEVVARAKELGLDPIVACSIVAIGEEP